MSGTTEAPVYGGVLVGGRGSRMGRPKHRVVVDDRSLLDLVTAALEPHVEQLFLLGAADEEIGGIPHIEDAWPARGPLAGILGALRAHAGCCWVIAACDLPLIRPAAVAWLLDQRSSGRSAILPRRDERGVEPLLAVYEPASVRSLEALATSGSYRLQLLASDPLVSTPHIPTRLSECWTNVNSPAELDRVRKRLLNLS